MTLTRIMKLRLQIAFLGFFLMSSISIAWSQPPGDPGGGGDPDCPVEYWVSGGGIICSGSGSSFSVTLDGSDVGVSYQLRVNGVDVGSSVLGTGSPISWANNTTTGPYTVMATNSAIPCTVQMNGYALITSSPTPNIYTLSLIGSPVYCEFGLEKTLFLLSSDAGISYQLKRNGTIDVGTPQVSTTSGSPIYWYNIAEAGDYTVVASNGNCTKTSSVKTITSAPSIATFSLLGGGSYCTSTPVTLTLDGSESGVGYKVYKNGSLYLGPVSGTGGPLNFNIASSGSMEVIGTNSSTGCERVVGATELTMNLVPTLYSFVPNSALCAGTQNSFKVNNSDLGTQYQLQKNGVDIGASQDGIGGSTSTLFWYGITEPGIYTAVATIVATGCSVTLPNSQTINPAFAPFQVGGGGNLCEFTGSLSITLSGSESGVKYELKRNGVNAAPLKNGTGSPLTWTGQTLAGTYTIEAESSAGLCPQMMNGSVDINVFAKPLPFTVSGSGAFCSGSVGLPVYLSGSEVGVNYQLKKGSTLIGSPLAGTGQLLSWPNVTAGGTYTIVGTSVAGNCSTTMTGNAVFTVNPLPTKYNVGGGTGYCQGGSGVSITLSNSQNGFQYQLQKDNLPEGDLVVAVGGLITWPGVLAPGTYTVMATNPSTGCQQLMNSSRVVVINPLPSLFNVTGGIICGAANVTVGLSGSESGVKYQLKRDGVNVGTQKNGTGSALTWGVQSIQGAYTIIAIRSTTLCEQIMTGKASLGIPPSIFNVSGGGEYCSGAGLTVTLNGSETGISYQLTLLGSPIGEAIAGSGTALSWTDVKRKGALKVLAINDNTGCSIEMNGEAVVDVNVECTTLNNLAFVYKYDSRNRTTHKKIPGADWQYMVYDDRDRLVLTQDGEQRKRNVWIFTKYDNLDRPILTGFFDDPQQRDQQTMQTDVDLFYQTHQMYESIGTSVLGYSNLSFPNVGDESKYLTAAYYDNYVVSDQWGTNFVYSNLGLTDSHNSVVYSQPVTRISTAKGFITATLVKDLSVGTWLKSVSYFDNKYRIIQTINADHLNQIDRITNIYDFLDRPLLIQTEQGVGETGQRTITDRLSYDHAGRITDRRHKVYPEIPEEIVLVHYEYNKLGQLIDKKLHSEDNGGTYKQSIDYRYNIRGWLTSINNSDLSGNFPNNDDDNDLFGLELSYNQGFGTGSSAAYNGNISSMIWSVNQGLGAERKHGYNYDYDPSDRLTEANFLKFSTSWMNTSALGVSGLVYDGNGNISELTRYGEDGSSMDILNYSYGYEGHVGNQLKSVDDTGDAAKGFVDGNTDEQDYEYDANGNMIVDANKEMQAITYNHLNLPERVVKENGESVIYGYDAKGIKLFQEIRDINDVAIMRTDYLGAFVFENGQLEFVRTLEGRLLIGGGNSEYQYHLTDHLGNTRISFTTKEEIIDENASLELARVNQERAQFLYYDDVRFINSDIFDKTKDNETNPIEGAHALRLNGTANERTGLAKSLAVMPGDRVAMEVYAKYVDPNSENLTAALNGLLAAIAAGNAPVGTVVDGAGYSTGGSNNLPFANFFDKGSDTDPGPRAYLNCLVFDSNFIPIMSKSTFRRMSNQPREFGQDIEHEKISWQVDIDRPGYVYIWLSNDEIALGGSEVEVYFDEFRVVHTLSPVFQSDEYYPFGLTFNSYQRENATKNSYLFNGFEVQDELELGWYDYGARQYDPSLGRFLAIDPAAEFMRRFSPLNYAFDNPMRFVDPDGLAPYDVVINGDLADEAVAQLNASSNLEITRDPVTGKLSAKGKAITKTDKSLLAAINDKNITVNVNATSKNTSNLQGTEKDLLLGAFGGSKVNADGTITARTDVNPNQAKIYSDVYQTLAGVIATHEILESYSAALQSPGANPPTFDDITKKTENGKNYLAAHKIAMRQDPRFVEPTIIGDNSSGTGIYYLRQMRTVPGVIVPFAYEQELFKKKR